MRVVVLSTVCDCCWQIRMDKLKKVLYHAISLRRAPVISTNIEGENCKDMLFELCRVAHSTNAR